MIALRLVGLLTLVLGGAALVLATYGLVEAANFAQNLARWQETQGVVLDPAHFHFRWMAFVSVVAVAGAALLSAGVALLRNRRWGLLAISIAAIVMVLYPWTLRWLGLTSYGFETIDAAETAPFLAVAAATAAVYWWGGRRVAA